MRQLLSWGWLPWLLVIGLAGCADEGVGQDCTPDKVPCDAEGKNCGFKRDEKYAQTSDDSCPSKVCIVYRLDNGSAGAIPADPRLVCTGVNDPAGCVTQAALEAASYCSCRCNRADNKSEGTCTCPDGFLCEPFVGSESFCVKGATVE